MSSLGGSTVSSSYNRLLVLPAGGGDGANLVSLTDGDNATTFGLKISTTDMSLPANGKLYFDGGSDTYVSGTSDKIEFYTNGQLLMKLMESGSTMWANALTIGEEDSTAPFFVFQSHQGQPDSNTTLHTIQLGGDNYGSDVLLLGRTDSDTSTNIALNAIVGIGTHADYPGGEYTDSEGNAMQFMVQGKSWFEESNGGRGVIIAPQNDPWGVAITTGTGSGSSWASRFGWIKHSDTSHVLGGLHGYGSDKDSLSYISIGDTYSSTGALSVNVTTGRTGIGTTAPTAKLHVRDLFDRSEGEAHLRLEGSGYSAFAWLDATAFYIGQNNTARDLRIYNAVETSGVALETSGDTGWGTFSDERVKTDIVEITGALDKLKDIRCVNYRLKDDESDRDLRMGVIAQDFIGKYDSLVSKGNGWGSFKDDGNEYYSFKYANLVVPLLKAVQELSAKVTALENA